MNANSLQRRFALLRLDLQARLGISGLLGAALIGLAAGALWITPKLQDDAGDLQKQILETRARLSDPSAQVKADAVTQAARFREWFPPAAQSPEDVRTLFRVAAEHKISLARGDYSTVLRRETRLTSYDVVLPVRAHYPAVRTFVIAALNALPHASLAELRVERGSSTADTVDARVHLTLYYRED